MIGTQSSKIILIVEDFYPMQKMIQRVVDMKNQQSTVIVANGLEAKQYLDNNEPPEIIISGWDMPKVTGLQLLVALRKHSRLKEIPFIMLTARADRESVLTAIKHGVDAFLLKPFRVGVLLETINALSRADYQQPPIKVRLTHVVKRMAKDSVVPNFVTKKLESMGEDIDLDNFNIDQLLATEKPKPKSKPNSDSKLPAGYVLIVDDEPTNVDVIAGVLKEKYKTKVATNGNKALQVVQKELPDIILLDIMMPGVDGFEVCQRLKADEQTKNIPVIFVSALTQTVDITKGFEVGAVDYITKPVVPEILLAKLKTHIDLAKSLSN